MGTLLTMYLISVAAADPVPLAVAPNATRAPSAIAAKTLCAVSLFIWFSLRAAAAHMALIPKRTSLHFFLGKTVTEGTVAVTIGA